MTPTYSTIEVVIIADLRAARAHHYGDNEYRAKLDREIAWETIRLLKAKDLKALEEKLRTIWGTDTYQQFKLAIQENMK